MNRKLFHIVLWFVALSVSSNGIASGIDKQFERKQILIGQNKLSYIDEGEGQAIIFLHGWSSEKVYWAEQLNEFSQDYRVILLDWRGQGESNGGQASYQFSELIDDLKLFIDSLDLSSTPVLVGHSMGGVQAMHFASSYPKAVSAIVSVDAPGQDNFVTGRMMYWSMLAAFRATGFLDDQTAISLHAPVNRYLFYSSEFSQQNSSHIERWEDQFNSNTVESLIHSLHALTYRERLSRTVDNVPSLFVLGSQDRFISLEQTKKYKRLFPGSQVKMISGAGHMSSEEQPEMFNSFLRAFLGTVLPKKSDERLVQQPFNR